MRNKLFLITAISALTIGMFGCSESAIDTVKGGVMEINPNVYVGEALDGYSWCKTSTSEWTEFESTDHHHIVEFSCKLKTDTLTKFIRNRALISQLVNLNQESKPAVANLIKDIQSLSLEDFYYRDITYDMLRSSQTNDDEYKNLSDMLDEHFFNIKKLANADPTLADETIPLLNGITDAFDYDTKLLIQFSMNRAEPGEFSLTYLGMENKNGDQDFLFSGSGTEGLEIVLNNQTLLNFYTDRTMKYLLKGLRKYGMSKYYKNIEESKQK